MPWENVFQLWVGYFPRSRSLKTTSETSGFLSFETLENSQRTVGKHLSTKNLENYTNRLLFLMYSLFSTILKAVKKILWLLVFREENFVTLVFREENFVTLVFREENKAYDSSADFLSSTVLSLCYKIGWRPIILQRLGTVELRKSAELNLALKTD